MKQKLTSVLLALCAFVAVFGATAGRAAATPNPPHGVEAYVAYNGCYLGFVHGNYITKAYSKMEIVTPNACGSLSYVRTVVRQGAVGPINGNKCGPLLPATGCENFWAGTVYWYQSTVNNATVVSTIIHICDSGNNCVDRTYNAI